MPAPRAQAETFKTQWEDAAPYDPVAGAPEGVAPQGAVSYAANALNPPTISAPAKNLKG